MASGHWTKIGLINVEFPEKTIAKSGYNTNLGASRQFTDEQIFIR